MQERTGSRRPSAAGWFLVMAALAAVLLAPERTLAQTGTIAGRVVQAGSLTPVAGAQVVVEGVELGSLTDANGRYAIANVPPGTYAVRVVHIGYRSAREQAVDVRAGATTATDFQLTATAIDLDEIVVTGTGAPAQRRQLGQTISSVTAEQLQQAPIASTTDALRGRVPGLVSNAMGETGSSAQIRLRGTVSLSQRNEPIIYIDGVRVDNTYSLIPGTNVASNRLDDLNAADIDRIEVIKGAAAATLYGTEASSGVIQIFTKRGQSGEPSYTFEVSQHGFTTPQHRIPRNYAYSPTERQIASNFPAADFLRTGHRQSYSLSMRGGTTGMRYYVSGRFMDERGTLPTNELSNWSGRVGLDFDHSEKLTSSINLGVIRNDLRAPQPNWGLVGEFVLANPWNVDENRPYGELFTTVPGALAYKNSQVANTTTLSATLNYAVRQDLLTRLTVGYNEVDTETILSIPVGAGLRDPDGLRDIYDRRTSNLTVDFSVNYSRPLTDRVVSTTTFGGQSFWETMVQQRTGVRAFPAPALNTLRGGSTVFAVDEFQEEVINAGVYVQQQFGFSNRLFLTAGVRMDGNSAFGENFGFETYPKVGASWVISDESFWNFRPLGLDLLRLRTAYGTSGLQPGAFDAQRTWRPAALINNLPAVLPENLGNPDLKPERSAEFEAAAELGFGDGRLALELVYWSQKTTDALLPVQGSPSNGFLNPQLTNIGSLESSGIEVSGNLNLMRRPAFTWDIDASVTTTDQVVADMGGVPSFRLTGGRRFNRVQEGYAPGAILAPIADPANPYTVSGGGIENLRNLNQITPNFLKNAAGEDSLVYIGDSQPTWTVSLGSTFRIGPRLTLRTLFSGEGGFIMSNETELIRAATLLTRTAANFARELDDPNTSTERRAEIADQWGRKHPNVISAWMEEADYLRWTELTLSYVVPENLIDRFGLRSTTLSFGVRNLALWTKYSGLNDPGTTTNNVPGDIASLVPNIDYFGAPVPRRFVFTLRATR